MVTVKSIAEKLNLSSATVSRALRNDPTLSIANDTKTRIHQTAEVLGYFNNKPKKKAIKNLNIDYQYSFIVFHKKQTFRNQIDSSYYYSVRSGIEEMCSKNSIQCHFVCIEDIDIAPSSADAILIVGNYAKDVFKTILSMYPNLPIATTGIISYYPERVDHITHSNKVSVELALQYFIKNNIHEIGYLGVTEAPGTATFGSRINAFINYMKKINAYNPDWVYQCEHGKDRVEEGYLTMLKWIDTKSKLPKAIFCANDPIALGALRAFHERNIDIPNDVSLISHDGSYHTQYTYPPLTTIDVNPFYLGVEACKALIERIRNERTITKTVLLHPNIIERQSVKLL